MTAKQKAELEKEMRKLLTDIKNGVYFEKENDYIKARDRFLEKVKRYKCELWAMTKYVKLKKMLEN